MLPSLSDIQPPRAVVGRVSTAVRLLPSSSSWRLPLSTKFLLLIPALLILNTLPGGDAECQRSTSQAPKCCPGRKVNCFDYTFEPESTTSSGHGSQAAYYSSYRYRRQRRGLAYSYPSQRQSILRPRRCYCDESCNSLKDCCPDYAASCRMEIKDCAVSSWGDWSNCNNKCGTQWSYRRRVVVQNATNGGQFCPVLEDRQKCEGVPCSLKRVGRSWPQMISFMHQAKSEVAHLLPVRGNVLHATRRYDMRFDERRNLFLGRLIKANKTEQPDPEPYCVHLEITDSKPSCRASKLLWQLMHAQSRYRRRHYSDSQYYYNNNQNNNNNYYSGSYPNLMDSSVKSFSKLTHSSQPPQSTPYYQNNPLLSAAASAMWYPAWLSHARLLNQGQRICVTCYPAYMQRNSAFRCSGTGMLGVETRWRALGTSDCQGHFRLVSGPQQSCTCSNEHLSFVFA